MASVANGQRSFKTTDEAADALVSAIRSGDRKGILTVLGRDGADIVSSGDPVADASARQRVLGRPGATPNTRSCRRVPTRPHWLIGQKDWPFRYRSFARTAAGGAGREEILYRRIGRNELSAIQACLAYADAQHEYALERQR